MRIAVIKSSSSNENEYIVISKLGKYQYLDIKDETITINAEDQDTGYISIFDYFKDKTVEIFLTDLDKRETGLLKVCKKGYDYNTI